MDENASQGHRKRLREKFLKCEDKGFLDYEALELLLTYAIPRRDVKPVAKNLMKQFKTLPGVLDARPDELCNCTGVGENSTALIKLTRSLCVRYLEQNMNSHKYMGAVEHFYNYARMRLGEWTGEVLMVFFLNSQNFLIDVEILGEGTTDRVNVYPAEIAKHALLRNAKSVVICHNHPSGVVLPSDEDNRVTLDIKRALKPLDIVLLDHIIVSKFNYYSYQEAESERSVISRILDSPGRCV